MTDKQDNARSEPGRKEKNNPASAPSGRTGPTSGNGQQPPAQNQGTWNLRNEQLRIMLAFTGPADENLFRSFIAKDPCPPKATHSKHRPW